ncbi:E3 SUMO-protein ligase ZBED1-like [Antennarius striatus]|uniref:E3 SUMO-protein ligase ZBED1-like n=1 Tax=Antennarius striatus TaxID=241820 RepID=UPI0035B41152
MSNRRQRVSTVWKHFKETDVSSVKCNICKTELAFHGSTTMMHEHLKRKHVVIYDNDEEGPSARAKKMRPPSTDGSVEKPADVLTESVPDMLVTDRKPLSVVDDGGIKETIKQFNPDYHNCLPGRSHFTTLMEKKYHATLEKGAGSSDDLKREQDMDEKHVTKPVISSSFSLVEPSPNVSPEMRVALEHQRQTTTETEKRSAEFFTGLRDEDELFLLSLLPSLKRLTIKKRMEVRMKFQQVLYAAEFED